MYSERGEGAGLCSVEVNSEQVLVFSLLRSFVLTSAGSPFQHCGSKAIDQTIDDDDDDDDRPFNAKVEISRIRP